MKLTTVKRWCFAAIAAGAIGACGGGSGGIDGTGGGGNGGIDGTGVSYGTITGFGSVWVNGVRFDVSDATIKLDDSTVAQADLRIGMVVRVNGSIEDSRAATITVDSAIKGRVEQVVDASHLRVMGQTVQIDNQTRFENGVVPVQGEYVEVHGLPVADGVVAAGYIERKSALATPPFAVKGFVKNHDTAAQTFVVGALTVNYTGATVSDLGAGSWDGKVVEVKGSACAGNPTCATLTATKVEPTGASVASAPKAEVEGFVTVLGANGFTLGATTVVTTASTVYEGGVAGDILVGTKLEVEGRIDNGVLTATKVEFRDSVRLEGDVASLDPGAGTVTLAGLPSVVVSVSGLTEFENVGSLAGVSVGDHLRIKARPGTGATVLAIEFERRGSSDSRVELQGPVTAVGGTSTLTILGTDIDTTGVSDNNFRGLEDAVLGRTAFFAAVKAGTLVKARGTLGAGNTITWNQLELED